ncbi:17444_t:CDS:2 [Cetraspora pellucida]|uniref:17444_t:CDS:1 n=1 Tax=Cetraspora pellucida TaxID=1433469 RepID=A0A9N9FSD2_9GLOM|nr:17444_t:CDS:2 [Cetraspora pellucida]
MDTIENSPISAHQIKCLKAFLENTVVQSPEILLDILCRINRILKTCYQHVSITSDKNALLYCSIIAKNQQILLQFLTNENKFVVYTAQKLLIQWIFLLSNKESLGQIDVIETQESLITGLYNFHYIFHENEHSISSGMGTEAVLEIYHHILKDFRHQLLQDRDEYCEERIIHHVGWRILNMLSKRFVVENYIVNGHSADFKTVSNEILLPSLSIVADIKKIEQTTNMVDTELINGIMNFIKNLSKKIDMNTIHICNLLNNGHHQIIRKVLKILLLIVESKSSVGATIECLSGILNYAKRIISMPDKVQLENLLNPDDDHTEFFDNGYYYDCNGTKFGLSLEIIKQLVQIYFSSYLSIVNILINDENLRNELICENSRQVLTNALEVSKGDSDYSVDCMFNLYVNNDNDLINFMSSALQLSVQLKKLAKLAEEINLNNETGIKWFLETILSHFEPFLQYCTPHTIFLKFLQSIGFEHSTILDFLISNETRFLEFFVTYCRYLVQDFEKFQMECYKFDKEITKINYKNTIDPNTEVNMETDLDTINRVNEVFCSLREIVQSLMDKQIFPYNASSLIKRIKNVEEMLNSLDG